VQLKNKTEVSSLQEEIERLTEKLKKKQERCCAFISVVAVPEFSSLIGLIWFLENNCNRGFSCSFLMNVQVCCREW